MINLTDQWTIGMLSVLWAGMMLVSVICAVMTGHVDALVTSITASAKAAFEMALGLGGVMAFWLGLMNIAEEAGFIRGLARVIQPCLRRLFPEVPPDHPAMGAMLLNIAANMLGLSNAATPFGLKAMESLNRLNTQPGVATNAMCMFATINTSSVQLIPATGIAFLATGGAQHPYDIVVTTLLATIISSIVGLSAVFWLQGSKWFKLEPTASGTSEQGS